MTLWLLYVILTDCIVDGREEGWDDFCANMNLCIKAEDLDLINVPPTSLLSMKVF